MAISSGNCLWSRTVTSSCHRWLQVVIVFQRGLINELFEGQSNNNRTSASKWEWNLFYSEVIARSVNTAILLGDEMINSSLVQRSRPLMHSQPHPLLHYLVRIKPKSTNVFLQVAKNVEITRRKIWTVRRIFKCFPVKFLKLIPHQIGNMGTGVIMQKDGSFRSHSRVFWLYGVSQHPQSPRNESHLSALPCLPPFSMLDANTLHLRGERTEIFNF